jgi:hypothetical protein
MTFREKQSILSQPGPVNEVLERHVNPPQAPQLPELQTGGQYDPMPQSSTRVAMPPMLPLNQMVQDDTRVRNIAEANRLIQELPDELKYKGPVPAQGKIDYRYTDRRSGDFSGNPNMAFAKAGRTGEAGKMAEDNFNIETLGALTPFVGRGYRGAQGVVNEPRTLFKKADEPAILKAVTRAENITEAALGTRDVAQEIAGEIVMGKQNKAAIKAGNDWLKSWIDYPDTQWKIHNDMEKTRQADREFFRGIEGTDGPSNIIERGARLYTPDVKEYNLGSQIAENAAQYLNPYAGRPIHAGNLGVSYTHHTPYYKRDMMENTQLPNQNPRYGDWMSRKRNISPEKRTSVVIHEGTHGWAGKDALKASGQEKMILDMLSPRVRTAIEHVHDLRAIGKDPEKIIGEVDTYRAYLGDPTEVHARIMQLRHHLGLKPSDVSDPEYATDVMRYIKALPMDESPIDSKFFSVIDNDPERLSDLFNKLWGTAPAAMSTAAGLEAYKRTQNQE